MVRALDLQLNGHGLTQGFVLSGSNLREVVHMHVPLSPGNINWYQLKGGDVSWLGM